MTVTCPAILPVTYAMVGRRPVFRTSDGSPLSAAGGRRVALEIDGVDHGRREGWSVVVVGVARVVLPDEVNPADGRQVVEPWPGGRRNCYVIVDPDGTTGRKIARIV